MSMSTDLNNDINKEVLLPLAQDIVSKSQERKGSLDVNDVLDILNKHRGDVLKAQTKIVEVRPDVLECDVVRFQNNKDKWVAFVGLMNGYPYEIFTGLQDDEVGIVLPKTVTKGRIIKVINHDGTKRYDFQFENKRGYKTTVEGISEKFNNLNYIKRRIYRQILLKRRRICVRMLTT